MVLKSFLFCCALMLNGIALAQSQDKDWKDFKVQPEPKKPQTSLDRSVAPYQSISVSKLSKHS